MSSHASSGTFLPIIGIELDGDGAHPGAWHRASHAPSGLLSGARIRETAQAADIAGFHFASFADTRSLDHGTGPATRLDAIQRAAFAAPLTSALGLVPEADVVFTEPFHLATQLASLDYSSQGRAGWILTSRNTPEEGQAVGRKPLNDSELAQERADVVEVNRRLWDSWEDDAVIRDVETGRYLDREKLHFADFEGERFSVKGPSIIPRPLQGQVVVFAPAEFAAEAGADVALISADSVSALAEKAAESRRDFAGTSVSRTVLNLDVILDSRGQKAADRLAELDSFETWTGGARYVGHAEGLVEVLETLLAAGDGVRLRPAVLDVDLPELTYTVLPELRRRGLVAAPAAGTTLRETLGLARPANRYAA